VAQLFQIPDLVRSRSADDDGHDGSEGGEVALLRFMRRLAEDDGARRAGINLCVSLQKSPSSAFAF
jgi:hypothetical protein